MAGTVVREAPRGPVVPPGPPPQRAHLSATRPSPWSRTPLLVLAAATTATALAWLAFLHLSLRQDEAGFLLLGRQWTHGTSLYGDYWVDRPPLLLWLFSVVGSLGHDTHGPDGAVFVPLRIAGAVVAALTVVLVGVLVALVAPTAHRRRTAVTVLAAALVCSPLLGMPEVDGELLTLPFTFAGLCLLVALWRRHEVGRGARHAWLLALGAGVAGTCAFLVKQSAVDVFVVAGVALLAPGLRHRTRWTDVLAFLLGAVAALGTALALADLRGTTPHGLWHAVVLFRLHASTALRSSASPETAVRLDHLVLALVVSGIAALLVIGALRGLAVALPRRGRPRDLGVLLAVPAVALAGWELLAVGAGGSYWSHYLTGFLPGVVLLLSTDAVWAGRGRQVLAGLVAWAVLVGTVAWGWTVSRPEHASSDAGVETYLRSHAAPGDQVVVAFGHADIVEGSGLSSPYPLLWDLPVRVRDPHLDLFAHVLERDRPRWVVVAGGSLATWGVHDESVQRTFDRQYVEVSSDGNWHVWERA